MRVNEIAPVKKIRSRRNGNLVTRNGLISAIDPATTKKMKLAAPRSSPIANELDLCVIALKVLKTSGDPFPNAKNVTPAFYYTKLLLLKKDDLYIIHNKYVHVCNFLTFTILSDRFNLEAIVYRFGQKKSEAAIPMNPNKNRSHRNY